MWIRTVIFGVLGMFLGGPIVGVLGALFGAWLDRQGQFFRGGNQSFNPNRQRQTQTAFFEATFMTMGRIAKADGRVNEEEIQLASALMDQMRLTLDQRKQAVDLFHRGKDGEPIQEVLQHFRQTASGSLIQMFLELQLQSAWADGQITPKELDILHEVCQLLGVNRFTFEMLHQRYQAQRAFYSQYTGRGGQHQQNQSTWRPSPADELKQAYATLGVDSSASDREMKQAWRKLMSEHHPDKLVSKGLPEEMMEMAKQKTQEIQAAYDLIVKHRKGH